MPKVECSKQTSLISMSFSIVGWLLSATLSRDFTIFLYDIPTSSRIFTHFLSIIYVLRPLIDLGEDRTTRFVRLYTSIMAALLDLCGHCSTVPLNLHRFQLAPVLSIISDFYKPSLHTNRIDQALPITSRSITSVFFLCLVFFLPHRLSRQLDP